MKSETYRFHVGCAPYHADFDPATGGYAGPSNARYQLLCRTGAAVAIIDYERDRVQRELIGASVPPHEVARFRRESAEHFAITPRWNAPSAAQGGPNA